MRRTLLFLPGNSPNILINADVLGADSVIFDLEDAVAPSEKDSARILVRNALRTMNFHGTEVIIRINSTDTDLWKEDLTELIACKPNVIMPPKVSCGEDVRRVAEYISTLEEKHGIPQGSTKIIPLIETARGVENAFEIAQSDNRVVGLFLGGEDYTADLRCKRTKEGLEIFSARGRIVNAARACELDAIDTPFTDVDDLEGLEQDAIFAKSLGFSGKSCISPRHVQSLNGVFSPTEAEIAYAREVLKTLEKAKAEGKGVVALRGKMIDAPIVNRAKYVLAQVEKS